jgi:hypothetical protein
MCPVRNVTYVSGRSPLVLVPQQTLIDRPFLLAPRYKGRYAMPIRMAKLTRSKNGDFVSLKGIPADVRDAYTRKQARGSAMQFVHTPASRLLEADVRELNEFLSRQQIEGGVHHGYIRIFHNADGWPSLQGCPAALSSDTSAMSTCRSALSDY